MTSIEIPLSESALLAWGPIIDSLLDLTFDSGISVQDVNQLIRYRSVRAAAWRITQGGGHASKSRIAAMTGIPRSEVARVLKLELQSPQKKTLPANNVLEAWHSNPAFLTKAGQPAVLPIFGKGRTFERLVQTNGRGTPVRAMFDQLLELRAITIFRNNRVKATTRTASARGLSNMKIANLGERSADLIETLKRNLKASGAPLFERTTVEWTDADSLSHVRGQIEKEGLMFANTIKMLMRRSRSKTLRRIGQAKNQRKIGVTVFYFEQKPLESVIYPTMAVRRSNLKRAVTESKVKNPVSDSTSKTAKQSRPED